MAAGGFGLLICPTTSPSRSKHTNSAKGFFPLRAVFCHHVAQQHRTLKNRRGKKNRENESTNPNPSLDDTKIIWETTRYHFSERKYHSSHELNICQTVKFWKTNSWLVQRGNCQLSKKDLSVSVTDGSMRRNQNVWIPTVQGEEEMGSTWQLQADKCNSDTNLYTSCTHVSPSAQSYDKIKTFIISIGFYEHAVWMNFNTLNIIA